MQVNVLEYSKIIPRCMRIFQYSKIGASLATEATFKQT